MDITLEMISSMDWVTVTDSEDPANSALMEVVNAAEMLTGDEETGLFMLISDVDNNLSDDEDEESAEAPDDETSEAYIFKVCSEEQAEFILTEENTESRVFVTTDFPEKEYEKAVGLFMDTTADFDIEVE